ncbi:TonB-dependent siderophore receptor [Ramlibacter sp. CrO1]|uniref:TonB-dependent siderophore receptor n=1 Tax=Ramlibacter algicola TaxID=2795217 RepID=A0A934Q086_9BURK|nr:TonB-dependent siderophore receptor [Ramlibacter algicola]
MLPFGALMLAASVGWAQEAPAPAPTTVAQVEFKPVLVEERGENHGKDSLRTKKTSIGKGTQDLRDIPQSVNVITEKLIDDARLDTLKEALHYTAGITFSATENGTDQDIRIRGFPAATTGDLLIDGMRDPSQYERDTFNMERIEVMRGSASMIFGRGSTGGVVNQVTKKPMLVDQMDTAVQAGTGGLVRGTVDFNKRTGEETALRLNAMATKAGNGGARVERNGIAPSYSWGLGTRNEFNVGLFHLNTNNVPRNAVGYLGGNVAPTNPLDFYGTPSDSMDGSATYASAMHLHRFAGGGELRTQLRTGTFKRAQWSSVARFGTTLGEPTTRGNVGDATILTRGSLTPRKDKYDTTMLQSDYSNQFGWFGLRHDVLAGIDVAREEAVRFQNASWNVLGTRPPTTVGTPDDGATLTGTGRGPLYRESSNYKGRSLGLYAQDMVQLSPTWKVVGGVRWDRFQATTGQLTYDTAGALTGRPTTEVRFPSLWSYRAGVLYQPDAASSYYVSYGTSFNTAADTYQFTTQQNANTPPEKSRNIEAGAKLDWLDGKLSTRAAIFRTEKFHERTTDADFAGTAFTLSGQRHSAGIELDVVGRLGPQWEVYVSYSFIPTAKIDAAGSAANAQASIGQRVGLTPRHTAAAWLGYQVDPQWRVAGGVHGASENFALQGSTGAAQRTARAGGYASVDLMAEYKATPDLFVQFNVNNVANRIYGDQLYPGFAIQGPGRAATVSVAYRY